MGWFEAPNYWLSRFVLERLLGLVYLAAFLVAANQFPALLGERGLLPVPRFLRHAGWKQAPSLFQLHYSDRFLRVLAWGGAVVAAALVVGLPQRGPLLVTVAAWAVLWVLYVSIVNVGQIFYGFGWESLLCEAGFLAIFLGNARTAPPTLVLWLFRWLVFRLEFGAGLIKMRGDSCWRDLTCLNYHHETQPMPGPFSWWFHRLPPRLHKVEVAANHVTQLVIPFLLFAPQPVASIAGVVVIVTQAWLVASGNFSWLNVLTMTAAFAALDDRVLDPLLPVHVPVQHAGNPGFQVVVGTVAVMVVVMSWWPVRNLVSRRQVMNTSFNQLHLVNAYGAFGSITRRREEIVIEGTADGELTPDTKWQAYEFKGKPGDPLRRPPQIAPYHLRLDWLMWFLALSPSYGRGWFEPFLERLLEGDRATLRLLRTNPFPDRPPVYVRARLWHYRFTTRAERKTNGAWWARTELGYLVRPVRLPPAVSVPLDGGRAEPSAGMRQHGGRGARSTAR